MKEGIARYCYANSTREGWINHLSKSHLDENKLRIEEYSNVIAVPDMGKMGECFRGGIFTDNLEPISISFQRDGILYYENLLKKSNLNNLEIIEDTTIYLGQYRRHYGSFIVDSIERLWFTLDKTKNYKFAFLLTQPSLGNSLHKSVYDLLEGIGIQKEQIILVEVPTIFKHLIIPELCFVPHEKWNLEFKRLISEINKYNKKSDMIVYDKVYFSRTKFSKYLKSDFGEEFISRFFEINGFKVIYPEDFSIYEQIHIVNSCKVFASIGGSCAHNIIFSETKPKVIIFNRMNDYQFHQWFLNEISGVEPVTYVDAYNEPFRFLFKTTLPGPYLYSINKNVKRFAVDNNYILPKIDSKKKFYCYLKYTYYFFKIKIHRLKQKIREVF